MRTGALYVARGTVKHGLPVYLVDEFIDAAAPRALPVLRHQSIPFVMSAVPHRAESCLTSLTPIRTMSALCCVATPDQATRCPIPPCLRCVAKPCPSGPGQSSSRRSPSDHSVTSRAKPALFRRAESLPNKPGRACLVPPSVTLPSRALRYRAGAYRSQTSRVKPALCFRAAPIHVRPFRATLRLTQPKPVARCQSGRDLPCRALPVPAGTRLPFQNVPIRTMPNSAETFQIRPWHA